MDSSLGKDIPRTDAFAKVTGRAIYTAEIARPGLVYAVLVGSPQACGQILNIQAPSQNVLAFLTHANAPPLHSVSFFNPGHPKMGAAANSEPPFQSDRVVYHGQPVACVVAATLEMAQEAAASVRVEMKATTPILDFQRAEAKPPEDIWGKPPQESDGHPDEALQTAPTSVDHTYTTTFNHHNCMELHGTLAEWEGDRLTIHDSSRFVAGERRMLAEMFAIPPERIRVISTLVGGAFGEKGAIRDHVAIAAMAARMLGRPVKLTLSRPQVTAMTGHRPSTRQRVALGGDASGRLLSVIHEGSSSCSVRDPFVEPFSTQTYKLYAAPHRRVAQTIASLNASQPTTMRAPGEAIGMFALESAVDELAWKLNMDPIALRLLNEPAVEPVTGKTFSLRLLRQCLERGAQAFNWARRGQSVGSLREGDFQIGLGMAAATYPFKGNQAHARCRIERGRALIQSSTHEFGNGITTVVRQIAADTLEMPLENVRFEFGDSDLPEAPISGGSTGTMWVGEAVRKACLAARALLPGDSVEAVAQAAPDPELQKRYSLDSYGAHFSEVAVHRLTREVRIRRHLGVFNVGRILSPRQARSQFLGAMTMGIGMALLEENHHDPRNGQFLNSNLDSYLVPVSADIPALEVICLDEPDPIINALGARGVGEIGIVGAAAAVANAVYHATGKRVRDLPIRIENLL